MPIVEEQKLGPCTVWHRVCRTTDPDIIAARTSEALIYVKLHKRLIVAFAILVVLGCGILLPIYAQGGEDEDELTKTVTFGNIMDKDDLIIATIVLMFVFTIICYYILIKFHAESMQYKRGMRNLLEERSIEITYIDKNVPLEEGEKYIYDFCNELMPGAVEKVLLAPDCKQLYLLLREIQELRENLEYYRELNSKNEKRAKILSGITRVDAEEKLIEDENKLKEKIDKAEISNEYNSSFAIVTCINAEKATELIKALKSKQTWKGWAKGYQDPLYFQLWLIQPAANPADIMWENIGINRRILNCRNTCMNTMLILMLLFIFTPTLFVELLVNLIDQYHMALEILILNLPAIVLLIYLEVLVPLVINGMLSREQHYRRSDFVTSEVSKYLSICIFLVFGAGLIGLQIIGIMLAWNWDDWVPVFGEQIIETGDFYTVLMMQMSFFSNGVQLLALGKLLKSVARAKLAETELEQAKAFRLEPWELGRQYSNSCVVFIVCLSYSLIVPYILVIALFYFIIKFWCSKNLLTTCYYIEYDSRGGVARLVLRALLCCISIFWFITGVMLILVPKEKYMSLGSGICFVAVCSIFLIVIFDKYLWRFTTPADEEDQEQPLLEKEQSYLHPCLQRSADDPYTLPAK